MKRIVPAVAYGLALGIGCALVVGGHQIEAMGHWNILPVLLGLAGSVVGFVAGLEAFQ